MPFLFNGHLAHGALPVVLKAGGWVKFAPNELAKVASSSITKNEIRTLPDFKLGHWGSNSEKAPARWYWPN
jgi:hypothetical protein